jgi:hypothetical protein
MRIIEIDEKCPDCKGTGLYIGLAERDGSAVVCHKCKGTGCFHYVHEYELFTEREERADVKMVVEVNPGICIGAGNDCKLTDFGGMSYSDWTEGKPFPKGSEMRQFTCPAWWYQLANYSKKPDWKECLLCGSFSSCRHFPDKAQCWERWDKENEEPEQK